MKDCEFITAGGNNSAVMIKRSNTEIDVLESDNFEQVF